MVMLRHVRTGQEEGGSVRVLVAGQWRQQRLRHHRAIVRWGESSQGRQSLPVQTRRLRAYTSCAQAHTQRKEQLHLTQQLKSSREPSHTMTENKSEHIVSHSAAAEPAMRDDSAHAVDPAINARPCDLNGHARAGVVAVQERRCGLACRHCWPGCVLARDVPEKNRGARR